MQKGWREKKGMGKLAKFKQKYPKFKHRTIFYDSIEWKTLFLKYSKLIPNWEFTKGGF